MNKNTMKEFDEKFGYTDTLETGESVRRIKGILLVSTVTDWIDTRLIDKKVVEEEKREIFKDLEEMHEDLQEDIFDTQVYKDYKQSLLNK